MTTSSREPNEAAGHLRDGGDWAEHEDHLIGDADGLRNLMHACEAALRDGEYRGQGLGDYVGVKRLESDWFGEPSEAHGSRLALTSCIVALIFLGFLVLLGVFTLVQWAVS